MPGHGLLFPVFYIGSASYRTSSGNAIWPAVSLQIKESGALSILLFQESACSTPICLPQNPAWTEGWGVRHVSERSISFRVFQGVNGKLFEKPFRIIW
ncbi:hypothetical protein HK16_19995 [Acetobacter senegalensis]|uniref:Uncharacterized protein n=2 Tax=Acetobacter TaxID=434 RepID=A0A252EES1_9PROT|nr:hypothetical protein CIW82_07310 [Acetobacter tropicalis]OUL64945.1 hypothetical protein HK16_19995 [Acetobacter senegalensis]